MMLIKVLNQKPHIKGTIFCFNVNGKSIDILFVNHAIDRINKWNLTIEMVAETLIEPEEVLISLQNRFIAHRRYDEHVLRAIYEYDNELPILITVYFPFSKRYFQGRGSYEDKIFERS